MVSPQSQLEIAKQLKEEDIKLLERYNTMQKELNALEKENCIIERERLKNKQLSKLDSNHAQDIIRMVLVVVILLAVIVLMLKLPDVVWQMGTESDLGQGQNSDLKNNTSANLILNLFEKFLFWLQVVMGTAFGMVAYLQWRDYQRQARQQETFTNYVESSTDFMSNASGLIDSMQSMVDLNDKVELRLSKIEDKENKREKSIADTKKAIDSWAAEFVWLNHRTDRGFPQKLTSELEHEYERKRAQAGIEIEELCGQYAFLRGQFFELVEWNPIQAINSYNSALETHRTVQPPSTTKNAAYRNRGFVRLYRAEFQKAIDDFTAAFGVDACSIDLDKTNIEIAKILRIRHQYDKPRFTPGADLMQLSEIAAAFEESLNKKEQEAHRHSVTWPQYGSLIRYWYANILLTELFERPDSMQKVANMLQWEQLETTPKIDWIRFRYNLLSGIETSNSTIEGYLNNCNEFQQQILNPTEELSVESFKLIYFTSLGLENDLKRTANSIRLAASKLPETYVYWMPQERLVSAGQLQNELEELSIEKLQKHIMFMSNRG